MKLLEAKVVVLGSQGVGKTSLILRYSGKVFNKHASPTIGASFFSCGLILDDYKVRLQVWDTAGQERFRAMAPMYYRNANAAFLVFDITSYESYISMKSWIDELKRNVEELVHICILGNKCDLKPAREVKTEEAQEYAEMIGASYLETSALTNEGIEEAFQSLSEGLIRIVEHSIESTIRVLDLETNCILEPEANRRQRLTSSPSSVALENGGGGSQRRSEEEDDNAGKPPYLSPF